MSATELDVRAQVVQELEAFRTLGANWDSYGADPISEQAIVAARNLLDLVWEQLADEFGERLRPYAVAPIANGGIQIEWRGPDSAVEIEIGPQGSLGSLLIHNESGKPRYTESNR